MTYPKGVDVSVNNGVVDWTRVKASGITFIMVKASQGHSLNGQYYDFTDGQFRRNLTQAADEGLLCGVYHYLTAATVGDARNEADYFISVISPYKSKVKLWAAVDVESDKYLPSDAETLTAVVKIFCDRVTSAGFRACIYTNPDYLDYRLGDVSGYPLWLALWRSEDLVPSKSDYPAMVLWQYGGSSVPGISGDCDSDLGIGLTDETAGTDYAALVCKICGLDGQTMAYIDRYKYAGDLWRKLYQHLS